MKAKAVKATKAVKKAVKAMKAKNPVKAMKAMKSGSLTTAGAQSSVKVKPYDQKDKGKVYWYKSWPCICKNGWYLEAIRWGPDRLQEVWAKVQSDPTVAR